MNSLKTVIVVCVMAVVAYGVYATLTKGPAETADNGPPVELPSDAASEGEAASDTGRPPLFASDVPPTPLPDKTGPTPPAGDAGSDYEYDAQTPPSRDAEHPTSPRDYDAAPDTAEEGRDSGYAVAADEGAIDYESDSARSAAADPDELARTSDAALESEFAAAKQTIEKQLAQDQLVEALRALTQWYDDPRLATDDQVFIVELLDKLSGTVVYSRKHWLHDPYIVRQGDTLDRIAAQYKVPWQILAKINGVADPMQLTPGDALKVIQGPFDAEVNLKTYRLTLFVDGGCYAGRFMIGVGTDPTTTAGAFEVSDKVQNPDYTGPDGEVILADDPANPLGGYWIGLGDQLGIHGMHDAASISQTADKGWIRLRRVDIEHVYDMLSEGSQVTIRR